MSFIMKIILWPLALAYGIAILIWDLYWRKAPKVKLPCRVISVGNITAGGAGKTPVVIYLAKMAVSSGHKTAVAARGWGRKRGGLVEVSDSSSWIEVGDEPLEVYRLAQGVRVYVDRSKTLAARKACDDGAEIIIIDDGFQHRRLYRDVEIVCLVWKEPLGPGGLLPSGLLREPARNLHRADILFYTSYDGSDVKSASIPANQDVYFIKSLITGFYNLKSEITEKPEAFRSRRVFAFCGLAKPSKFKKNLDDLGIELAVFKAYRDHYHFNQNDVDRLVKTAGANNADCLITTYKDAVKIRSFDFGGYDVYSAMLEMSVVDRNGNDRTNALKSRLGL